MEHAARISRAQAVAVPRPQLAANHEWLAAAVALGLLLLGLLAP